jgi:putative PIN family toxin of toxin-antitoxin system
VNTLKAVIDTNVFVSGLFFSGPPSRILKVWQNGQLQIAVSPEILDEYRRVIDVLSAKLGRIDLNAVWEWLLVEAELVASYSFEKQICEDPDDDKFLACAMLSHSRYLISGDRHLLKIGTFLDTVIITPRQFLNCLL